MNAATDLASEITELCAYINAANYRLLRLIAEFDRRRAWEELGLVSCAHWMNLKCGIGLNAAREKVRIAHALTELPKISAAFEHGELSYSKVRAMTRVANADNEDYLLMIARHGTAQHMEKLVQKTRRVERLGQDTEERHAARHFDYYFDEDGFLVVKGRLPAEQGALLIKALQRQLAEGDVSAETSARRADGLANIAELALRSEDCAGNTGDRYQVVVHVSAETSEATLDGGPAVHRETARRLACECSRVDVTEDAAGEPLSIGRKTRSIPPAIRRALKIRDGGCRFPGCTNHRFVDGHHIQHWAAGGETSLNNLVLLCRHHHRLVHEGGYGCEREACGNILFRTPAGDPIDEFWPMPAMGESATRWLQTRFAHHDIDAERCVPEYRAGERIDWHLAVAAMFPSVP